MNGILGLYNYLQSLENEQPLSDPYPPPQDPASREARRKINQELSDKIKEAYKNLVIKDGGNDGSWPIPVKYPSKM